MYQTVLLKYIYYFLSVTFFNKIIIEIGAKGSSVLFLNSFVLGIVTNDKKVNILEIPAASLRSSPSSHWPEPYYCSHK